MAKKNKKIKEYLFVDGYNIVNSWERFSQLKKEHLEEARNELIEIMTEYKYYSGIEVIIVFDAHLVKGNYGAEENYNDLKVVYTKENETADQYIEKKLDEIGRIKRVRVATSDWMEQQIVFGRGGTRISARELEMEIFNEKKLIKRKSTTENKKNDLLLGRLDEETIKKLNNLISKNE
ncbi:NYN domain-containing protein [Tissierella carlieri]|uniref:NYN domain-containing protein n=1 Tax=Tissierella carlieri TaxID=689904 RepID=UPI001C117150|nr:NYN domain-containing protein [Tissierella carlieri]MBU5311768.1 NYN domain-containing protein [Tissierella carlieri]